MCVKVTASHRWNVFIETRCTTVSDQTQWLTSTYVMVLLEAVWSQTGASGSQQQWYGDDVPEKSQAAIHYHVGERQEATDSHHVPVVVLQSLTSTDQCIGVSCCLGTKCEPSATLQAGNSRGHDEIIC